MSHKFRKPKPISDARRAAARANGAKSQGPVTPEGKAKSALNAITHGLTASTVVLTTENKEKYEALLASYRDEYDPQGQTENDLVDEVAAAKWLHGRALSMITSLLDVTMDRMDQEIKEEFEKIDNGIRTALAFAKQADQGATLVLLHRYAARHTRDYHRALDKLRQIQSERRADVGQAPGLRRALSPPDLATSPQPLATEIDYPEPGHQQPATNNESQLVTSHEPLATETGHPPIAPDHCILQNEPKPAPLSYNNPTTIRRLDDQPSDS